MSFGASQVTLLVQLALPLQEQAGLKYIKGLCVTHTQLKEIENKVYSE